VTRSDGTRASSVRIASRTAIFFAPHLLVGLVVLMFNANPLVQWTATDPGAGIGRSVLTGLFVLALFVTARRRNGWVAAHDLVSGTHVVSRAVARVRSLREASGGVVAQVDTVRAPTALQYGPFTVVADAGETGSGRLLVGFDPILRRQVWIHVVSLGTPAVNAARRDVGRAGRLHWLTGRRSAGEAWDAYEAPDGARLLSSDRAAAGWPSMKVWLLDLVSELIAATADGTMPPLSLDAIWIRHDGRLVLLDFRPPGGASTGSLDTPASLVSAMAARVLATCAAPAAMPLSARTLLTRWSRGDVPALDTARDALSGLLATPDTVLRWRRAVPIALASAPVALIVVAAILVIPVLGRLATGDRGEALQWLESLANPNPPPRLGLGDPAVREAAERYVASRYRAVLADERFWNSTLMERFQAHRRVAQQLLARHPSVTPEELARATEILAPQLERAAARRARDRGTGLMQAAGLIVSSLAAVATAFVVALSVLSTMLVPGGVFLRHIGLAVVTRTGAEASRLRALVRLLVAWLPALIWFGHLAMSPRIQGFVPVPPSPLLAVGITLGVLAVGAGITVARPVRGPHDRLAGTWVVPR